MTTAAWISSFASSSTRSVPARAILGAVDEVFKACGDRGERHLRSGGFPPHIALPDALPSVVEIWEPLKPEERKEIEGWDAPFDAVSETSPRVKLARERDRARLIGGSWSA